MALILDGQNITTDPGDSGTYTWDDIVALGSTNLITHTTTNGKPIYRWVGLITLKGTSTLTATGRTIEFLRLNKTSSKGQLIAKDSAKFNIYNSSILITYYDASWNNDPDRFLLRSDDSGEINAYETSFYLGGSDSPINIGGSSRAEMNVHEIRNCIFLAQAASSPFPEGQLLYVKGTSNKTNIQLNQVSWEVGYDSADVENLNIYGGYLAGLNWYLNGLILRNYKVTGSTTYDWGSSSIVFTTFVDGSLDLSKSIVYKYGPTLATGEHKKAASHNLRIKDESGNVQDAIVTYTGRTTVTETSNFSGLLDEFILIYQETDLQSQPNPGGDWVAYPTPIPLVDYSEYTRLIKSYPHIPISESLTIGQKVGSSDLPFDIQLVTDAGVTQSNTTTVAGYTGISHTSSATTISGTRTLAEAYDSRKLYWRNNGGLYPSLVGVTADWGAINLVISGTLTGVSKFRDGIKTSSGDITIASPSALSTNLETVSGTVTLQSAGNYSGIVGTIGALATVVVASGSTNLQGWVGNGSTINVSSGSATVTVDDTGDWVAGSGVTLQQPQVSLTAANFADGTRVQVAHRQVFTVSASAINTTTNAITIGNDSNGDAAAFSTSPRTLVRFTLASGATIPTTSPQIEDGGLYYADLPGSALSLRITSSGSAIDFSSQGSGSFTLTAETELANEVVSGGSGYSHTLSLSNNALVRVKAEHWDNPGGVASCSIFYDEVFAWSSVAGYSIIAVVDNTVTTSQDAVHERLVAESTITLEGEIKDASGAKVSTITLPDDGSTVAGLSFALEGVGKIQVNADDANGILSWQELYLWGCYIRSTEAGIRLASATTFVATNIYNYVLANLEFDNTSSTLLKIVGGIGRSSDGGDMIAATSGSINFNAVSQGTGAEVPTSGGGPLTPEQDAKLSAIDTKVATLENGLTSAQSTTLNAVKTQVDTLYNGLTPAQETTLGEINTAISALYNGLTPAQATQLTAIKTQVDSLSNGLTSEQLTTLNAINTAIGLLYNGLTPTQATQLSSIQTAVGSLYNGLTPAQITQLDGIETTIAAIQDLETDRNKAIGLISGVSASQKDPVEGTPGYLRTSDNAIDQTLTLVDGEITITRN